MLDLNPVNSPTASHIVHAFLYLILLEKTATLALKPSVLKIHMGAESVIY